MLKRIFCSTKQISIILLTLGCTQALAYEGASSIADCGSDSFSPGDLPAPHECTYPSTGTMLGYFPNTDYYRQVCNASLIYKDEDKAVMLTATHCTQPFVNNDINPHIIFEPQPSIPFTENVERPLNLTQNIIPVVDFALHPLYVNINSFGQEAFSKDVSVLFLDMNNPVVANALDELEPYTTPPSINYLNTLPKPYLSKANMSYVGYSRLTSDELVDGDYANAKPSNRNQLVPAQHNRRYGPAEFVNLEPWFVSFSMKISEGETIGCYGDSGSPAIMEHEGERMILGVYSLFSGNLCNQTSANWYARLDERDNWIFIQCAIDPYLSIEESMQCIDDALN